MQITGKICNAPETMKASKVAETANVNRFGRYQRRGGGRPARFRGAGDPLLIRGSCFGLRNC